MRTEETKYPKMCKKRNFMRTRNAIAVRYEQALRDLVFCSSSDASSAGIWYFSKASIGSLLSVESATRLRHLNHEQHIFSATLCLFISFVYYMICASMIDWLYGMSSVCVGARQSCAACHIRISFRSQGNEPWRTRPARPRVEGEITYQP